MGLLPAGLLGTITYGALWCRDAGIPANSPFSWHPADCLSAPHYTSDVLQTVAFGLANCGISSPPEASLLETVASL